MTASAVASGSTPTASRPRRMPRGSTGFSWSGSRRAGSASVRCRPGSTRPTRRTEATGPPSQIDVYTGGNVRWADVKVPGGAGGDRRETGSAWIHVGGWRRARGEDHRPGGQAADRRTGQAAADGAPRAGARALHRGGRGRGRRKRALGPEEGPRRLVPGRRWRRTGTCPGSWAMPSSTTSPTGPSYDGRLSRNAPVSGQVTDDGGQPLSGVEVRIQDVATEADGRYDLPFDRSVKTDAEGRFRCDQLPRGKASVWVYKFGYCRPGLGLKITTAGGWRCPDDDQVGPAPRHGRLLGKGPPGRLHREHRSRRGNVRRVVGRVGQHRRPESDRVHRRSARTLHLARAAEPLYRQRAHRAGHRRPERRAG